VRREGRAGRLLLIALAACGEPQVTPLIVPPQQQPVAPDAGAPPRVGEACAIEEKEICTSDEEAIGCHRGKWEVERCSRCANDRCTQSIAAAGDVCTIVKDMLCSADAKAMMTCNDMFRWTAFETCHGEKGCVVAEKKVTCDNSVAAEGEACMEEQDYACAADGKSALVCHRRAFGIASRCRGKGGCRVLRDESGARIECDDSVAEIEDACEKDGHYACSSDAKSILKCVSKKFVQDERCKKKERCAVRSGQVGCY
jgi:hypothetical protein